MRYRCLTIHIISLGLIIFMPASLAYSLDRESSLSFSCGIVTLDQVSDMISDVLTVVITAGTYNKSYTAYSPAFFVTYRTSANGKFGFGGTIGTYSSKGDLVISSSTDYYFKERSTIVAAEADYKWIKKNSFQLYSGFGVGARFRHGTYGMDKPATKVFPTFHVNLIGFRVGKQFGVFGEAGVGYKGVINMGFNYRFN